MNPSPLRIILIALIAVVLFGIGFAASRQTTQYSAESDSNESGDESASSTPPEPGAAVEAMSDTAPSAAANSPTPSGTSGVAKPAPSATPTATPAAPAASPYFFTKDEAMSAITRTTIRLEKGADIPLLAEPGARLLLTNISGSGNTPIARIELRRGAAPERIELATGGTVAVASKGAKQVVLEASAINPEDDSATIRILSFPATRLAPSIPATAWLLQNQTFSHLNEATGNGVRLTVLSVLANKVQLSIGEYQNGSIARTSTQWITDTTPYNTADFTIDIADIDPSLDPAYASAEARWAPHAVAVQILPKQ